MRLHLAPAPLLHLIATILLSPTPTTANPHPPPRALGGFDYNELFARWECNGVKCGYSSQLCCNAGSGCYTNYLTQAECTPLASQKASGGYWTTYMATTVTDEETVTTTVTRYIQETSTARCNYALGESSCGRICCDKDQYCKSPGHCAPAYPGETTTTATEIITSQSQRTTTTQAAPTSSASPGVRQTTSSGILITQTSSPTTTVAYITPVATGANVTISEFHSSAHLSGGAIAGIVIGVLVGLFLLALLCFCCCLRGIWDGLLAIFGFGKKKRVTEVDEYTRRTHYSSGGQQRTWYGAPKKSRREREERIGVDLLGVGAGLAGLWALLGLKRRRDENRNRERREQEKYSESNFSSNYYTSAS